jgi:hypothetical protein
MNDSAHSDPAKRDQRALDLAGGVADRAKLLYLACAAIIVLTISWVHLFAPVNVVSYERDVWHHTAVLNALLESPFHAVNPHIVSDAPSRSYMPWYVGLAIAGRWFGLDSQQLLGISAALSILAVMAGIYLFARSYFPSPWAPLALLGAIFGTWIGPFNHTGFNTLPTMTFSASYPFAIVFGAGFIAWWLVLRGLRGSATPWGIGTAIALITAFAFTIHQLQGGFNIGGMLTFALFHGRFPVARRAQLVLAVVAGLLISSLWPYYNPIALALIGGYYSYVYDAPIDWSDPVTLLRIVGFSALGLGGLYDRRRKAWRLDLVLGTAGIAAGIAGAGLMGSWIVLRLLPFLVIFLQLGLTALVFDLPGRSESRSSAWRWKRGLVVMIGAMMISNAGAAVRSFTLAHRYQTGASDFHAPTWARDIKGSVREIKEVVGAGSVVIANGTTAYPIQADGMKVVSIPLPFPEVPDAPVRQAATLEFFGPATELARRCEILATYHVNAIVYRTANVQPEVRQSLNSMGTPIEVRDLTLVPVSSPPEACRH